MWLEPGKTYHTVETLLTPALKLLKCGFCSGEFLTTFEKCNGYIWILKEMEIKSTRDLYQ